ncbi:MAG: ribosome small subunit-dependent GTPase A [Bacteroidetes bacterium]|nr:ribosome small subunit-dependent GTPase A [Bacteroidota bacterium]
MTEADRENLRRLGWDAFFQEHLPGHIEAGLAPARVIIRQKNRYTLSDGTQEWSAEISGRIHFTARTAGDYPAVGDWVVIRARPEEGAATIHAILPRKSSFVRKVPGVREEEQVVAANIDTVFLVNGFDAGVNIRRIERYLVAVAENGARPVIVLNKADLDPEADEVVEEVRAAIPAVPLVVTSAKKGSGLEQLLAYVGLGQTAALLGPSGVGKSTIVNALLGEQRFATDEVRLTDRKGRHVTSHRELVVLPSGGLLIDTPGMRELQLWDVDEGVQETFDDIEELAAACKFRDCKHAGEPGCAVRAAVEDGTLDEDRLASFAKLQREIAFQRRRTDKAEQLREKQRWKKLTSQHKRGYKK